MSQEELDNLSDSKWTELTDNTFTLNPGSKYVAYVKITDNRAMLHMFYLMELL